MKPVLYAADEAAFISNGIGVLADCISCEVSETLNGEYEMSIAYPVTGIWADDLEVGQVIKAKANDTDAPQLFQIYDIVRSLTDAITVKAEHISYRLCGVPVSRIMSQYGITNAINAIVNNAIIPLGFTIDTDITSNEWFATTNAESVRSLLGNEDHSLLTIYGGEYHFDNFDVHLLSARGANNGVTIRYGKNLTALEQDINGATYNGVFAYWYKADAGYVEATAPAESPGVHPVKCYQTLDLTSEWENPPTAAELYTRAQQIANGLGSPLETLDVSFVTLHQLEEYSNIAALEQVALGDYVTVIYDALGINRRMRVVKTVYNSITEMYESITLGTLQTTLADVINKAGESNGTSSGGVSYTLSISGSSITLVGSDGSTSVVNVPDQYAGSATSGGTAYKAASIPFGEVDNTSTATVFTATVPGITELKSGVCCMLQNGVVTSASGFTVNVNNLGAKPCYTNLAAATRDTTIFNSAYTMLFVYNEDLDDGAGGWIIYRGYDANTNTIGYQVRTNSSALPASDKFYRYRLLFTSADGTKYVPANTSTSTNATASRTTNTRPIDPFGEIKYYSTTTAVDAGSKPSATAIWQQYTLTLGYSFNTTGAALTMTADKPVYLRCAPQADGSAVMEYFTQALPSTADGKIYIYLGIAYSATAIELSYHHPVYYYNNSGIRLWTGA